MGQCQTICKELRSDAIKRLELSFTDVKLGEESLFLVLESLIENKSLKYLKLEDFSMGKYSLVALCKVLSGNRTLKKLVLNRCILGNIQHNFVRKISGNKGLKCIELNNCELDDVSLKVLGLSLANGDCPATKITLLSNNFSLEGFYHFLVSMENARPLKSFDVWIELSNLDSEQYLNSKFPDSKRVHVEKISDVWQTLRVKVISENSAEKLFFSNGDFDEENTIPDYLRHIFNVEKSVDFKDASTVEEEEFYCIDPKEVMDVPSSHVADSRFLDQDNESIIMHSESEFYMDYIFV